MLMWMNAGANQCSNRGHHPGPQLATEEFNRLLNWGKQCSSFCDSEAQIDVGFIRVLEQGTGFGVDGQNGIKSFNLTF